MTAVLAAQEPDAVIRTTVQIVVAPTTVTDSTGKHINGLTAEDFLLFDNKKPRPIQADVSYLPISLVIAIQTSSISGPALEKIRMIGSMVGPLLVGESGDAAVLLYGDDVSLLQSFTSDENKLIAAMRRLRPTGVNGVALDAINESVSLLKKKEEGRRRILLLIGESRDRGSKAKLDEVVQQTQSANVIVYSLTYSALMENLIASKQKQSRAKDANVDIAGAIAEASRLGKTNIAELFPKQTGGMTHSFVKETGLENAVEKVGEEIHNQYLLSFTPLVGKEKGFHKISVRVKNNPDAIVRTRPGYWPVTDSQP